LGLAAIAHASNPLEYPDNGSASFSRGGAWLAVGNEPIATHYNPAALATQSSGFSLEQQLNFPHTCFDRRAQSNAVTGPSSSRSSIFFYRPVCNERGSFPNTIPSFSVVWRVSDRVGIGFAIVPPATYGTSANQFPALARGFNTKSNEQVLLPAPYRYQELEQQTTILFPTIGVGYALTRHFRVGVAFVSGVGIVNTSTVGVANLGQSDALGDHMADDSLSSLRTEDLFVPGAIVSLHFSPLPQLDLSVWGRWMDSIRSSHGVLDVTQQPFDGNGKLNPPCAGAPDSNGATSYGSCSGNQSVPNHLEGALTRFEYPIPPELRWGVRFHQPRTHSTATWEDGRIARDPLHDDTFDVEVDQSLTLNSLASTIVVRFRESEGKGTILTNPTSVPVPPNADRPTGYKDSLGIRVGGQWNIVRDLLGLRAGGWLETRSQDPTLLTIAPVGATRFGFGGGLVVRYHFLDVSVGYQRHLSAGLDNGGNGGLRAPAAVGDGPTFDLRAEPPGVAAVDRRQFRTVHAVNGGSVSFDAHVFTLGGVVRF
jgi:long-chain fatty acid transport protein